MNKKLYGDKNISMRTYLTTILIFIIFLQGVILLLTLTGRNFYTHLDQQINETFISRSDQQIASVNDKFSQNVKSVISASDEITAIYTVGSALNNKQLSNEDITKDAYEKSHVNSSKILLNLLDKCVADSAFLILDDERFNETVAVDIRNTYPDLEGDGYRAYQIAVGSSAISIEYELGIHKDWDINIDKDELLKPFFTMPLKAVEENPYGSIEQYGYWNYFEEGSHNGQMTYTVPLIDERGKCYGVVGIGISEDYFKTNYVNPEDYAYGDNIYAIASQLDDIIVMKDNMANTEVAKNKIAGSFVVDKIYSNENIYKVDLKNSDEYIVKIDRLYMYSSNSQFIDYELVYLTLLPSSQIYENSNEIKEIFSVAFAIASLIGIFISWIISKVSTRKIKNLSKSIDKMSIQAGMNFEKTGLSEIDDLTNAITQLNDKVIKSAETLNHLFELTELNIGGFEEQKDGNVTITQYINELLEIPLDTVVTTIEWKKYFEKLTESIIDSEKNIYIFNFDGEDKYLKITSALIEDCLVGMVLDVTKEIKEVMEANYKLDYDALTGLYSRTAFYNKAKELIQKDPYKTGCVMFIDLDNLKFVNDTFGHDFGDKYLIEGSKIFSRIARGNGIAARMSGDEFAVYLHGYYCKDEIRQLIYMHLEDSKSTAIDLPDGTVQRVRFSSGIAWYGEDSEDINELVKYADFAMYDAKHTTKGTHREFNKDVYDEKIYVMENTEAINKLIEEQLLDFMFQPIVCLKTGEVYGYEALMRSKLDVFKSPLEILQVASSQFKLKELESAAVTRAVECAYEMRDQLGDAKIYINSIASQVMPSEKIEALFTKYGDFMKRIVIEITEAEDNTPEKMKLKVDTIKNYGMKIAIDDFGSGYSNELRIIAIDPDVVKLDRELIQGIYKDPDKQTLCNNIIAYCHSRGTKIIAEGVEVKADLIKITELGADFVQGYYVQKPSYEIKVIDQNIKDEIIAIWKNE